MALFLLLTGSRMRNTLYYGDNLWVLKEYVKDSSVDLIYLDPPFNSDARYNVLFESPDGAVSGAQAEAFHDTWRWTEQANLSYDTVIAQGGGAAEILRALRSCLGTSNMMAYLANMTVRLRELRRALKPTGSLYLHCDSNASHYLKIILDGIFGAGNFRNEIVWKRQSAHSDAKSKFPAVSDTILFYAASKATKFLPQYADHDSSYVEKFYRHDDGDGRGRYQLADMSAPKGGGMAAINKKTGKPNGWHIWKGYEPPATGWRYSPETMAKLDREERIYYPIRKDGSSDYSRRIRLKRFLNEQKGSIVTNVWADISPVTATGNESLGYPTQKPLGLIKRIINASSRPGDVVLDPFCGCGTTVHAAHELGRKWIGIDVSHYAIGVIESRLKREFSKKATFSVVGRPTEIEGARELAKRDKFQFQWWANWLVGVQNYRENKRGPDQGIDGIIYFRNGPLGTGRVVVSVKGGDTVSPDMVRALSGTVNREKAELGLLVCLAEPTLNMRKEASGAGFCKTAHGKFPKIQIVTIQDLLDNKKPNLPPEYKVEIDERLLAQGKKKEQDPQMSLMLTIRGDKDATTYPSERTVATFTRAG